MTGISPGRHYLTDTRTVISKDAEGHPIYEGSVIDDGRPCRGMKVYICQGKVYGSEDDAFAARKAYPTSRDGAHCYRSHA